MAFVPFFLSVLSYFAIINTVREKSSALLLATSLIAGAVVVSVLEVLTFFKIYVLPFAFTKTEVFNTFGSLLDQLLYLFMLFTSGNLSRFARSQINKEKDPQRMHHP